MILKSCKTIVKEHFIKAGGTKRKTTGGQLYICLPNYAIVQFNCCLVAPHYCNLAD